MILLVNIIDEEYERLKRSNFHTVVEECVRNGTPIPDNATNGNVIKEIFPNCDETGVQYELMKNYNGWWNAPYKKGGKE